MSVLYSINVRTEAEELAKIIDAAASPPLIVSACAKVEAFLQNRIPQQAKWFFSITFPTLLCKLFGFDSKPLSPSGWIDIAALSDNSELSDKIFSLGSPNGILLSSISAVDRHNLVRYIFPNERLPAWVQFMLLNERDSRALADLCPMFNVSNSSSSDSPQVQLNVFAYYMFWFAYYPVFRGDSERSDVVRTQRSNMFRLENWAYSIPCLSSSKRGTDQKNKGNLYIRIFYAYLRTFVPIYESNDHQPYVSSLLHYSRGNDIIDIEIAEFLVNLVIQFWLVNNDFSPFPLKVCKSYRVVFPSRLVLGETPPTSSLGEVINLFVKYLSLSSVVLVEGGNRSGSAGHPYPVDSWTSWMKRPLYRFILRTLLFCPVGTSLENVSQVFNLWVNYMEPWKISVEEFTELDAIIGMPCMDKLKHFAQISKDSYSSSWQRFVLANYLYYNSLVMHFLGFAHKFLHTEPERMVQMVSKVISILTSSTELMNLIKNVEIASHSKVTGLFNSYVPTIREELQDWEDGLCERDADGSFLSVNWNKDLLLFSESEGGGQWLLQLFVRRAVSELHAIDGNNVSQSLECLNSLNKQICDLYGIQVELLPSRTEPRDSQQNLDLFRPTDPLDVKYTGDRMLRPITNDEIAWLANLFIFLSVWLNKIIGLDHVECSNGSPTWSYVDMSDDRGEVCGASDTTAEVVSYDVISWLIGLAGAGIKFMRKHGMRVNLRILASKKLAMVVFTYFAYKFCKIFVYRFWKIFS